MTRTNVGPPDRLRLEVLGRIELRREGEELEGVLAQPKRLGLLAYLALRHPRGVAGRDELVGIFWPESTERHARGSLRQALRFLRSRLGADAIVNRGDGVRVGDGALACDAVEFRSALEEGEGRRAVDAYGGELLPGLFVAGSYEFDRWLQAERQTLRSAAVEAALRLAGEAEADRDLPRAADRVRWALEREPTDEAVARRLIALLGRIGDRAGAEATYRALEAKLAEELELTPSPETVGLIEAVRKGEGGPAAAGPPARRAPAPDRILVLALEDLTGDPALAPLGRLAAEVVAQGLAAVPDLEVVPPMAGAPPSEPADGPTTPADDGDPAALPAGPAELALRTGAGTVVGGTYLVEGDELHLRARITDVVNDRLLRAPEPVVGRISAPLDALEELRDRVATTLAPALTSRVAHVRPAARPPSIEAYSAYLAGMDRFIRRDWRGALEHLRTSADLEPRYALPRIVRAITHWNLVEPAEASAVAEEARALGDALGPFERAVLDMVRAWLAGDWAAAYESARTQARLAPGSIPHFQVAEEARRLNRPRETREVLSRLDPETGELEGWIFYWIELTEAHHLLGDHRRELELANRCRRLHPDDPVATLLEIRALAAVGRAERAIRLVDEVLALPGTRRPAPGALLREAALELRVHGAAEAAGPLLERAVDWYGARAGEPGAEERERAVTLYHAGRFEEARTIFRDLVDTGDGGVQPVGHHHGHLQGHLDEGYLAVIAVREGDHDEEERWRRHLEELRRPFLYGAQWFWLAAVAALREDPEGAVALLRRAFREGLPHEHFIHTDPHLFRLRGHAAFDALMRPKG